MEEHYEKKLAVLLAAALTLGMSACGASKGAGDTGRAKRAWYMQ